jgi:hypothetical protein
MSEPSDAAVNEERVNEFREHCNRLRRTSEREEVERIYLGSEKLSLYMHLAEAAEREKIMEAQVTRALMHDAIMGGASVESCRFVVLRSPWGRFGSILVACKGLRRVRETSIGGYL